MQALHHKLDAVLVQILRYNCSETDYSFGEDLPPSRIPLSTQMRVSPSDPFSPHYFFAPPPLKMTLLKSYCIIILQASASYQRMKSHKTK